MVIQHNMSAMNANRQLGITQGQLQKSTEKLSSGYRINRAGDDAAGLAISEKMRGQIRGLNQASTNSEDGISLVQTAEGALQETQNILQRMRELAVQSSNDTNTDDDREQIQKEIDQLTQEVDRIATTSEFNTKKLLDGTQQGVIQAKDGTASVESTFQNGLVTVAAIDKSVASLVQAEDTIRITILADATSGAAPTIDVKTLNGTEVSIGSDGTITVKEVRVAAQGDMKERSDTTLYNGGNVASDINTDLTISMSNVGNLKAGDVITIKLTAGYTSSQAKTGKESLRLQVGSNSGQEIDLAINSMKAKDLGIIQLDSNEGEALDVSSQAKASLAITAYDNALNKVSTERAHLGAIQNRLEHTIANLDTSEENLQASESRIRDVDMADEMTKYSKNNILQQAGTSMLAQANQSNQTVLSLLG